jgi:hypothetical protein
VREAFLWYERTYGEERARDLLTGLPDELRGYVDADRPALGILPSTWYPVALVHHALDRATEGERNGGRALARAAVDGIAPMLVRGVYKILYRALASPELYARHVPRMWRQLHSTGSRTLTIRAPGEALSVVEGWDGHHPALCWITIFTMATLFESMQFTKVSVDRIACVSNGAPRCETVLRYSR